MFYVLFTLYPLHGRVVISIYVSDLTTYSQAISLYCNIFKGFYYARPMPVREFVEFIKKQNNK